MTTLSSVIIAVANGKYTQKHILASRAAVVGPPFAAHTCHGDDATNHFVAEGFDSPLLPRRGDRDLLSNDLGCKERKNRAPEH
mmetsp:Transcript_4472/g.9317  ORF Transcript_4472/g.9317 Transcript_4472/m.9317 type:complete len:83 (-) Transcript_4472:1249-1497(-)